MDTNVGILAVGNEVVEGQIVNRNAAWLAAELDKIGANPLFHLSCRDQPTEITQSLNFLSTHCHLIVVCGGLGPTRDDTTRQSLSTWMGLPLQQNEEQWKIIREKLEGRRLKIREGHKNQALIPVNGIALANENGVAPGFFVKSSHCFVASLPGPPSELRPMFLNFLKPLVVQNLSPKKEKNLKTWICLGAPESEVAHVVESILGEEFEIGYRLHKPYVEVKIWLPTSLSEAQLSRLRNMEEKLKPWWVAKSILDIRKSFDQYLQNFSHVFVIDHLSSGLFLEQIKEYQLPEHLRYQCFEHKAFRYFNKTEVESILNLMSGERIENSLFISLFPASEHSAYIGFNLDLHLVETPRSIPIRSRLGQLYALENCFLKKTTMP